MASSPAPADKAFPLYVDFEVGLLDAITALCGVLVWSGAVTARNLHTAFDRAAKTAAGQPGAPIRSIPTTSLADSMLELVEAPDVAASAKALLDRIVGAHRRRLDDGGAHDPDR